MHAWNYGRRARAESDALSAQFVAPFGPHAPALTEIEAQAAVRLTIDRFHAWAVRGWWSVQTQGDST